MPTPVAALSSAVEARPLLDAASEEEYRRLLHVLRMAGGHFALIPVESALAPAARDALLERLQTDLAVEGTPLRVARLTREAWDPAEALLPDGAPPRDGVTALVGLEETPHLFREPGAPPQRPPALAVLNHAREAIRRALHGPLLVWCDPLTYTALQEHAPDFFDHFSALFRFAGCPAAKPGTPGGIGREQADARAGTEPAVPGGEAALAFYEERLAAVPDPSLERARVLLGWVEAVLSLDATRALPYLSRAEAAAREALGMVDPQTDAPTWARAQETLGRLLATLPAGDSSENLRRAVACYQEALRVYTERDFAAQRAAVQNNLGNAYRKLPTGDRGENLHRAIACFEAALHVYTERDFPAEWATTQNNLGTAYADLPTGDRGENLRRAIACNEAALRIYTERDFPAGWAMTQNNLGVAYRNLPTGDRGASLRRAIACYEAALRIYTERDFPAGWAMTQNNLGNACAQLPTGDRGENLRRAIACYEAALRVRTERDFPARWAMTRANMGFAYGDALRHGVPGFGAEAVAQALHAFTDAHRGYRAAGMPDDAQRMQVLLGILAAASGKGPDADPPAEPT